MKKNYSVELTGLFGDPADENPTGVMMEAGYRAQGLNYRYLTLKVKKEDLKSAMEAVRFFGMKGVNLTVPHKIDVIPYLDELSLSAEIIGAVNSVCNRDGKLIGENTDGKGLVTSLMELGEDLCKKTVTVLGAGSAARAAAVECAISGAKKIYIINRNQERGEELAALVKGRTKADAGYYSWEGRVKIPKDTDILVNCTCAGLHPDMEKPDIAYEDIHDGMTVCDMAFHSPETEFLKEAKKQGAKTVGGIEMLVNQAALNYSLWTENIAPKEILYDAMKKEFALPAEKRAEKPDADEADRRLIEKMTEYNHGDPKRIQHFIKVYEFARRIGEAENIAPKELLILKTAAIVHDIGIRNSEKKYGCSEGKYQEIEGPPEAEPMLAACGYEEEIIDRVLFLIANHHTYDRIEGADYQILVEADFLVNLFEHGCGRETAEGVKKNIFKTKTGIWYLEQMFLRRKP